MEDKVYECEYCGCKIRWDYAHVYDVKENKHYCATHETKVRKPPKRNKNFIKLKEFLQDDELYYDFCDACDDKDKPLLTTVKTLLANYIDVLYEYYD